MTEDKHDIEDEHGDEDVEQDDPLFCYEGLTHQMQRFVEVYARTLNASKAARVAGYASSSAHVAGCRLLKMPKIKDALRQEMEKAIMPEEEVVARLTSMARGSIEVFMREDEAEELQPLLDFSSDLAQDNLHLIKELEVTEDVVSPKNATDEYVLRRKTKIKLHDAKDALKELLRAHGRINDAPQVNIDAVFEINAPRIIEDVHSED